MTGRNRLVRTGLLATSTRFSWALAIGYSGESLSGTADDKDLEPRGYQRFPGACQIIALCALPNARISAFPVESLLSPLFENEVMHNMIDA